MTSCPDTFDFHVELRVCASIYMLFKVGEDVGLPRPTEHRLINLISQSLDNELFLRFKVDSKEDLPAFFQLLSEFFLDLIFILADSLIEAVL